ncbi:MAG: alanine racemase [Thermotaleaceae bacterium]
MAMVKKQEISRETWIEIDLDYLLSNYRAARKLISKGTKLTAVLKANAYGHGALDVASILIEEGVDYIAVACLSEALELRKYFTEVPLLVMGFTSDYHLHEAIKHDITLTIFTLEQALTIGNIALAFNKRAKVHVKLDTGLNRLGIKPNSQTIDLLKAMTKISGIVIEGIFSHLALTNEASDQRQFQMFMDTVDKLEKEGIVIPIKHICDSIGMVRYPEYHLDMVRVGAFLYGVRPMNFEEPSIVLPMPLTFKSKIAQIKEVEAGEGVGYDFSFTAQKKTILGVLPVGYADGYMRCLSNVGEVSLWGKRAPVIGTICMDQTMVDLTEIPEARVGDEVLLLGGSGETSIPVLEVAEKAQTNRNEVLSVIGRRVPRVYIQQNKVVKVVDYILD